jgi:hypothetical protein
VNRKEKVTVRVVSRIIVVILAAMAAAFCYGAYRHHRLNGEGTADSRSYEDVYAQEEITLDVADDGLFTILKMNDTHFLNGTCEDDQKTLAGLASVLDGTPCDLIIVDGDLVEGDNQDPSYDKFQAIDLFAQLIEGYQIPWTFAPGNNDGEIDGDNESIIAYMMQYEHFLYGNEKGIDGSMQFFINLNDQGRLAHAIAIMDSGMREPPISGSYRTISENQAQWLLDGVDQRKVKTSVFFHMQTNAFQQAFDHGEAYDGFTMYNARAYDEKEGDGLFDQMIEDNAYISLLSCGHQHSNNMCSYYHGRYYQLSSVSGYGAVRDEVIIPSCTLTTINVRENDTKKMYTFSQITVQ